MDDRISDPWGERTPYGPGEEWPVRVDEHLPAGEPERWAQAASLLHSNGDAMDIAVSGGRIAGVRGRPCDYGELSYERLRGGSGIQWGGERLYADGRFKTEPEVTETYGQELGTGAAFTEEEYRAKEPGGRAFLQAAAYEPSPEAPSGEFPLLLTTGRTLYQFHTRTKTGRAPELDAAAPEAWAQLSEADARSLGVAEGDMVRVRSPRGAISVPARVGGVREGVVFLPFRYGDRPANELTLTAWDPVSYQPVYKIGAARVEKEA